jgi:chromosome segregation ATPase
VQRLRQQAQAAAAASAQELARLRDNLTQLSAQMKEKDDRIAELVSSAVTHGLSSAENKQMLETLMRERNNTIREFESAQAIATRKIADLTHQIAGEIGENVALKQQISDWERLAATLAEESQRASNETAALKAQLAKLSNISPDIERELEEELAKEPRAGGAGSAAAAGGAATAGGGAVANREAVAIIRQLAPYEKSFALVLDVATFRNNIKKNLALVEQFKPYLNKSFKSSVSENINNINAQIDRVKKLDNADTAYKVVVESMNAIKDAMNDSLIKD